MPNFVMPTPSRDDIWRGIRYMVAAVVLFSVVSVLIKWLVAVYPVTEVVFFRSVFALLPCLVLVMTHGGISALRTERLGLHALRSLMQFAAMFCSFIALGLMPLADVVALSFSSPLFLTVLSIPLLGEQVRIHRWTAVLVGFAGVLIMVRPGAGMIELGALLVLANAVLVALVSIIVRRMSVTESSTTTVFYQIATASLLSVLLLPFGWVTPTWVDAGMLAAAGLISGASQFMWIQAFRFAPAAVAAPFTYTAMIWAVLFGYLVWGDVPTLPMVAGAVIVAASGLYILHRETVRRTPKALAPVPGDD
ncbi:MAG: DMT family transporter [Pseudomonadota bacterium]